jgi:hypothetical protein
MLLQHILPAPTHQVLQHALALGPQLPHRREHVAPGIFIIENMQGDARYISEWWSCYLFSLLICCTRTDRPT